MNRHTNRPTDDRAIAELLQLAGPRAEPPRERAERVMTNVKAHWRKRHRQRSRPARTTVMWLSGLAAALLVSVGVLRPWSLGPDAPVQTAQIVNSTGTVLIHRAGVVVAAADAATLAPGERVETGADGLIVVTLASGHELRLDHDTRLGLEAANHLALEAGAVYVDSGVDNPNGSLSIETPYGVARDVGTQFEVRLSPQSLEVSVREGKVHLSDSDATGDAASTMDAGEGLRRFDTAPMERFLVSSWDARWEWTRSLVQFEPEGALVIEYLEWLSREQGWTLTFEDARVQALTRHEAIGAAAGMTDLSAEESLDVVLPVLGLTHRFDDGGRLAVITAN